MMDYRELNIIELHRSMEYITFAEILELRRLRRLKVYNREERTLLWRLEYLEAADEHKHARLDPTPRCHHCKSKHYPEDVHQWQFPNKDGYAQRVWKPFQRPKALLNSPAQRTSPFLQLPSEIIIQIFNDVRTLPNQLALALTSKYLLQVSVLVSTKELYHLTRPVLRDKSKTHLDKPQLDKRRVRWPPLHEPRERRSIYQQLLERVAPLDEQGSVSKAWKICPDCRQWRPTRREYWAKKNAEAYPDTRSRWNDWECSVNQWCDMAWECPESKLEDGEGKCFYCRLGFCPECTHCISLDRRIREERAEVPLASETLPEALESVEEGVESVIEGMQRL